MNFLNPAILFGLIAAGIPILLHLLNLRRIKKIEFSSLKFLKELKRSQIRRIKLRQILLLILRTLLIILIVTAFSRPIIKGSLPGFRNYAKTSAVILIDNSPSMNFSDEFGNRFNYAKRLAKKIAEQLRSGDEVAIIELGKSNERANLEFHSDYKTISDIINKIQIGYSSADISDKLDLLPGIFDNAKNVNKEVFIISDNQSINFKNFDTSKIEKVHPSFYFFNIGQNSKIQVNNLSLDSIKFATRIFQENKPLVLSVEVLNHSPENKSNTFVSMIFGNERVAQKKFSVNANFTNDVSISANLKNEKIVNGYLELENDVLEEDNRRFFGIILPNKPKIAYVANEPNPFILSALGYGLEQSYCESKVLTVSEFNSLDLNFYDAVIISNYENISINKLNDYLNNGGRSLFLASDELKGNETFLSSLKIGNIQTNNFASGQNAVISYIMKSHPLFQGVFIDETSTNSPDNVRISKLIKVESGLPIIETTGGNLLTEIKQGEGLILFLGIAPNADWSNLQNSTLFPIIMYRSLLYLSMLPELSKNVEVGKTAQIIIPSKFAKGSNFKIIDPNNIETPTYAPSLPSGVILNLKNLDIPGNYLIKNANDEFVGIVSANLSREESKLESIPNDDIVQLFEKKYGENVYTAFIDDFTSLKQKIERVRSGTELWYFLIFLAIVVAISELVVQRVMKSEVVED